MSHALSISRPGPTLLPLALAFLAALTLPACSGDDDDDGGGGGEPLASADILVGDAPADDLLLFSAVARELRLEQADGTLTDDLLQGELEIEFLGLTQTSRWLASTEIPAGVYEAALLVFETGSYRARSQSGALVDVDALSDELRAPLPAALEIGEDEYRRILIDLDLVDSLDGDVTDGVVTFDPSGSATPSSGDDQLPIDELDGRVRSFDRQAGSFVVDAFADDDLIVPVGVVTVLVEEGTVLIEDDGGTFPSQAAFFDALSPQQTLVEVHGGLGASGIVRATRIEIEDSIGGGGDTLVEIEGIVLDRDPGQGFELQVREIEKGAAVALPVLDALGDPASIAVGIGPSTEFRHDDGGAATEDDLVVGQEVDVRFLEFDDEPFLAARVEIEDDAEYEGRIVALDRTSPVLLMFLNASEPAVQSGQVASPTTGVVVELLEDDLFLNTDGKPALEFGDLVEGLRIEVRGTLEGSPAAPVILADRIQVKPGRLDGAEPTSVMPTEGRFQVVNAELEDPFGEGVSPGPLSVILAQAVVVDGDADSVEELFALLEDPNALPSIELEIEGIGSGVPNEIVAYEIEVDLDD